MFSKFLVLIGVIFLLIGCGPKEIQMVDMEKGIVLDAKYQKRTITVIMPNGEVLKGKFSAMSNTGSITTNRTNRGDFRTRSTANRNTSTSQTVVTGGISEGYAILTSESSNLTMEINVEYSEWNGNGRGTATTNDGRTFKVQF